MREIKFRAWEHVGRRWLPPKEQIQQIELNGFNDDTAVAWMQFTGLHDKNGKEIYEGDIVRRITKSHHERIEDVYWRNRTGFQPFAIGNKIVRDRTANCEVIGNIYENPELLHSSHSPSVA